MCWFAQCCRRSLTGLQLLSEVSERKFWTVSDTRCLFNISCSTLNDRVNVAERQSALRNEVMVS